MKKIINYEKELIFKTTIAEICSISLEQDFTIDGGFFRGDFILDGEYKVNELSVNKESFSYHLPLEYELDKNVDYNTVNYEINNFEYTTNDDILKINIDMDLTYDVIASFELPVITEEELNEEITSVRENEIENIDEIKEEKNEIIESTISDDTFITYHVHFVKSDDTLESIAQKYGTTINEIKKYNNIDNLELKSKLIIPECDNE